MTVATKTKKKGRRQERPWQRHDCGNMVWGLTEYGTFTWERYPHPDCPNVARMKGISKRAQELFAKGECHKMKEAYEQAFREWREKNGIS